MSSRLPGEAIFFKPAYFLAEELKAGARHVDMLSEHERAKLMEGYQSCFDAMDRHISEARSLGRMVLVKEHITFMINPIAKTNFLFHSQNTSQAPWTVDAPQLSSHRLTRSCTNETVLPDEFLRAWKPIFLIRHPALVFPSVYRTLLDLEGPEYAEAQESVFRLELTLHWTRSLYDWYVEMFRQSGGDEPQSDGPWPLVLEADDILTKPAMLSRFCDIVELDSSKLRFAWPTASDEERASLPSVTQRMKSTLLASSGVITNKTATSLNLDIEAKQWRQEFGETQGAKIEQYVKAALPDYEYMKAKRLRCKKNVEYL